MNNILKFILMPNHSSENVSIYFLFQYVSLHLLNTPSYNPTAVANFSAISLVLLSAIQLVF